MESKLKKHLIQIADKLKPDSTLEDVYEHLSLLTDIEISENQEKNQEVFAQEEVQHQSKQWLK